MLIESLPKYVGERDRERERENKVIEQYVKYDFISVKKKEPMCMYVNAEQ